MWRSLCVTLMAVIVSAICQPGVSANESATVPWNTDIDAAFEQAHAEGRPVLLHFWTPECVPCRRLEHQVFNQPRVIDTLQRLYVPVKINAKEFPELAQRYHVNSVPKDVIVTANDEEVHRMFPPQDADQYVAQLSAIAIAHGRAKRPSASPEREDIATKAKLAPRDNQREELSRNQRVAERTPREEDRIASENDADAQEVPRDEIASKTRRSTTRGKSVTQSTDDVEPKEVINRFARQNTAEDESTDVEPTGRAHRRDDRVASRGSSPAARGAAQTDEEASQGTVDERATVTQHRQRPRVADSASATEPSNDAHDEEADDHPPLGMDGYCPVTLVQHESWKKGNPRYGAIHRGRTYLFAGPKEKEMFLAHPDEFSPILAGVDPVELTERGEIEPGQRQHGVLYHDRVYLFSSEANLQAFWKEPDVYVERIRQAMETGDVTTTRR